MKKIGRRPFSTRLLVPITGLLLVCIFIANRSVMPALRQASYGFIGRYTAALLLVRGGFGPQVYQDDWFSRQVQATTGQPFVEIFTPNPPTLALLTVPLVWLSPPIARNGWIWVNSLVLAIALGWLMATFYHQSRRIEAGFWALSLVLITLNSEIAANFRVGQVYTLLLGLFILALWGLVKDRDWLVGVALGLAIVFKTSGLPLWLLLLVRRRWRAFGWGIGTVLAVGLVSLPWIGLETWLAYPWAVWIFSQKEAVAATAYQTVAGFLTHLFRFDPVWNPAPIYHWPALAQTATILVAVGSLTLTLWLGQKGGSVTKFFSALLVLSIILLPVAEEYHFILLAIPIFVLVGDLFQYPSARGFDRLDWLLTGGAILLLAAPIPYKQAALGRGWLAVLAYPRLFGSWLIWIVTLRRMQKDCL